MNTGASWSKSYSHDINATQQIIWQTLADASTWKRWNPGVKSIQIKGEFATGTWFLMGLPEGETIRSQLIDVAGPQGFTDETQVGETVIRVEHKIEIVRENLCRVVYTVSAHGADAQVIGEAVSADFPDVLVGLEKYIHEKTA